MKIKFILNYIKKIRKGLLFEKNILEVIDLILFNIDNHENEVLAVD